MNAEFWTVPSIDDGLTLRAYDLRRLKVTTGAFSTALRCNGELEAPERPLTWWLDLAGRLCDAVGSSRWPEESSFLGWQSNRLLVRQTEDGHRRILEELQRAALRQVGVIPLELVRLDPRTGAARETIRLDVPWSEARGHIGPTHGFLDYDCYCGMSMEYEPYALPFDMGLGVLAQRVATKGTEAGEIAVRVAWSTGDPDFQDYQPEGKWSVPERLELPSAQSASWDGVLPVTPGRHPIVLDDGTTCVITVGREWWPASPPTAVRVSRAEEAGGRGTVEEGVWIRLGLNGVGPTERSSLIVVPTDGTGAVAWWDAPGKEVTRADRKFDDEEVSEGATLRLLGTALSDGGLAVDLELSVRSTRAEPRSVPAVTLNGGRRTPTTVRLPQTDEARVSRRIVVPVHGAASLDLRLDVGGRVADCRLVLARVEEE